MINDQNNVLITFLYPSMMERVAREDSTSVLNLALIRKWKTFRQTKPTWKEPQ